MMIRKARQNWIISKELAFSAFTYVALSINMKVASEKLISNLLDSFEAFRLEHLLLFPALYILFSYVRQKCLNISRPGKTPYFLACLFSFFMLFGCSYEETNTWNLVLCIHNGQIIKSFIVFAGYSILFFYLICYLFNLLDRKSAGMGSLKESGQKYPKVIRWYIQAFQEKPFLTMFLTMLIAFIPNMIMSYPARLMGDTPPQIVQAFNELKTTGFSFMRANRLLRKGVYINQAHPVAHTMFIHVCLQLGDALTGGLNPGLFLYVLIQAVIMIAAFSYALAVMIRKASLPAAGILVTVLYVLVQPLVANYVFLVTKDTIYAALILICITNTYRLVSGEKNRLLVIMTILDMLGIVLFRNEGRYVLYVLLLLIIILNKSMRKRLISMLLIVAVFSAGVFHVLYPALGFTPGSKREMLSIPFQQTARYICEHEEEINETERKTIDAVLVYDKIRDAYQPDTRSDYVKNLFRESATSENLKDYFRVWAQMGLKHPDTYIQATMNNYYQYFYPGKTRLHIYVAQLTQKYMDKINKSLSRIDKKISRPDKLQPLRNFYDYVTMMLKKVPGFDILFTPAVYSWVLILLLFWTISRRHRKATCVILLPFIILMGNLLGPCNGFYGRYQFPFIFSMPIIIWTTFKLSRQPGTISNS